MSKAVIVTGCLGLVGGEISRHLSAHGYKILGIDCDLRPKLFKGVNPIGSEEINFFRQDLGVDVENVDIRNMQMLKETIQRWSEEYFIVAAVHTAAQPSHDWAANNAIDDFEINAKGTLNLLEVIRELSMNTLFIQFSTNKVYGDTPNYLPLNELEMRYEIQKDHKFFDGIDETMSIDHTKHSLFGVSKTTSDLYAQEYARYFGMKSVVLRGGCLTGAKHRGHQLHGFLNYLVKCEYYQRSIHSYWIQRKTSQG